MNLTTKLKSVRVGRRRFWTNGRLDIRVLAVRRLRRGDPVTLSPHELTAWPLTSLLDTERGKIGFSLGRAAKGSRAWICLDSGLDTRVKIRLLAPSVRRV